MTALAGANIIYGPGMLDFGITVDYGQLVLSNEVITCMSVTGSILIIGLALNILGSFKLKVMNYMPAIFMPAILIPIANWLGSLI